MHHDRLAFNRFVAFPLAVCGALSISAFTETSAANPSDGGDSTPHHGLQPGDAFADELLSGGHAPEMVVIPAGQFRMGCASDCRPGYDVSAGKFGALDQPAHLVTFGQPFALSKFEITNADYDRFIEATAATLPESDTGSRKRQPRSDVSWDGAVAYVQWLSSETGAQYRLPSEAEWEYAARAGTSTKYHFQDDESQFCRFGNHLDGSVEISDLSGQPGAALLFRARTACSDGIGKGTAEVGRYLPNDFGLYDMHGNVAEWTRDCWNGSYSGAPTDGSAWETGDCSYRVKRGGAWITRMVPAAFRTASKRQARYDGSGFRIARTLHVHSIRSGARDAGEDH